MESNRQVSHHHLLDNTMPPRDESTLLCVGVTVITILNKIEESKVFLRRFLSPRGLILDSRPNINSYGKLN